MTASLPLIEGADLSVVLALGEAKRAAWGALQNPALSAAACRAAVDSWILDHMPAWSASP
jgi:hypothetical protein